MLTGYLPFDGRSETEVRLKIEKGNYTAPDLLVPEVSKKSKRLIQRLLKANASSRMNANELLTALQTPDTNPLFSITEWVNNITDFVDKMPVKRWLRVNND